MKGIRERNGKFEVYISCKHLKSNLGTYKNLEDAVKVLNGVTDAIFVQNIMSDMVNFSDVRLIDGSENYACKNGKIYTKYGDEIKGTIDKNGYIQVCMSVCGKQKTLLKHRVILKSFNQLTGYELLDVNHIDGDKTNNKLANLEWCTRSENIKHSFKHKLQDNVGNQYGNFKVLDDLDVEKIINLHKSGLIDKHIAEIIGCSRELISRKIRNEGLR